MTSENLIVQENSEVVRQGLQNLGAQIPQVGRLGIYKTGLRIKTRMGVPGSSISYPVHWDSDEQRRAFFFTDGFGGGVPHSRGDMNGQWELIRLETGYQIRNNAPGSKYVYGDEFGKQQSLIHKDRWPLFKTVTDEEVKNAPNDISDELRIATIAEGFAVGL